MAGRGRGRGRTVSFNVEALGINKGEVPIGPVLQPPPLFPPQEFKPVPLKQSEDYEYICALKKEFIGFMKKSPYYIQSKEKRKDIDRYSDKYQSGQDTLGQWNPDWRMFPDELKPAEKKVRKFGGSKPIKPNIPASKKSKTSEKEISKTLEKLEKKEAAMTDKEGEEEEEEEGANPEKKTEEDLDLDIDEEIDEEEETDYILTYFDNGETYGDDDDDDDGDGPIY
ncbi:DNA-directed RNA polymerase III subunit RPC7-like [Mytilus galloprovincialis]|uniref:DNA-directed RNA polymerase III subunit RPC7-like n=1 Tax=Mytilus galloprovincialis TaxID=29158 RepID=UPI003F7CB981